MDWTEGEVKRIVPKYFEMLEFELKHLKYNKSEYRRSLIPYLQKRTHGSIERKNRNISAVLANMGLPFIKGYLPDTHYQILLEKHVALYVKQNSDTLIPLFENFVDEVVAPIVPAKIDFAKFVNTEGPISTDLNLKEPLFRPIKINYLEREQSNRILGEQGEKLVIEYEKWRLQKRGQTKLINQIKWISKTLGDGAGYDILSKNEDGSDRFIEVKATKRSKETPIYLTKTELAFSDKNHSNFFLYRVFNLDSNPQLFIKHGPYSSFCTLQPLAFKGTF